MYSNRYNSNETAEELLKYFESDIKKFNSKLDELSGSFAMFIISHDNLYSYSDSLSTKPIFYDICKGEVASHPQIFAECYHYSTSRTFIRICKNTKYKNNSDHFLPGLLTPFETVFQLTPNTRLVCPECRVERFFPCFENPYNGVCTNKEIEYFLLNQTELLCKYEQLSVSVTAGYDSRLTLASTKRYKDNIFYYTIPYNEGAVYDTNFAHEMMSNLGCKHHVIEFSNRTPESFLDLYNRNISNMSSDFRGQIAYTLERNYPKDRIHVKSNSSDICKHHYRMKYPELPKFPSATLCSKIVSQTTSFSAIYKDALHTIDLKSSSLYGYDVYDLLYWEFRLGKWQSLCCLEWSIVQQIILPCNCRKILCMLLGATKNYSSPQVNSYLETIIADMWPEAAEFEFNKNIIKKESSPIKKALRYIYYRFLGSPI